MHKPYALDMVHRRLQAVREDYFESCPPLSPPLHVGLVVHMSSWWPRLDHFSYASGSHDANRLTCISLAGQISRSGHADHLCMHKFHTLPRLMVHLILPVVREDHF